MQGLQMRLQVAVRIRQTVRKVNCVISLFKIIRELHLVEHLIALSALLCVVKSALFVSDANAIVTPLIIE
jgi:hypothetical protein